MLSSYDTGNQILMLSEKSGLVFICVCVLSLKFLNCGGCTVAEMSVLLLSF